MTVKAKALGAKSAALKTKRTTNHALSASPRLRLSVQFGKGANSTNWPLTIPRMRRMIQAAIATRCVSAEITVVLTGQAESRRLNAAYRNKDYPTNVLTFDYVRPPKVLADLVICQPIVAKEARTQGKRLDHHAAHLLIHGTLHACGLDHLHDKDAETMEGIEIALLRRFRIPDPYCV